MSKHHHQNKAEQIYNRTHGAASFHYERMPYQTIGPMQQNDIQKKVVMDDTSIQAGAFEIYSEKEGPALDHWLEVDRILRNSDQTVSGC